VPPSDASSPIPCWRALVGHDETSLKHALAQLEHAGLVFRRGEPPEAVYSFKHALVRDAAYESLLKSRRQQLHGQIARATRGEVLSTSWRASLK